MTYHVVGCRTCTGYWLAEDIREQATADCPHCGTTHDTSKLNIQFEHDAHGVAAEIRSRILAQQAGELDAYDAEGSWLEQASVVEDRLESSRDGYLAERAANVFADHYTRLDGAVKQSLERWTERNEALDDAPMDALSEIHDRFAAEADTVFEDHDTRFADEITTEIDFSTVEHDAPEDLGTAGSLSLTRQETLTPDVRTTLDTPLSDIARTITDGLRADLVATLRDLADGRTALELQALLHDAGIAVADADLLGLASRIACGSEKAVWEFGRVLTQTEGRTTTDDFRVAAQLLALSDRTPTIAVRLDDRFLAERSESETMRRSQREAICEFLSAFARGCDVRLVGTGLQQLALYRDHRDDLRVNRGDITPLAESRSDRVKDAKATLDPDSREVRILRLLADQDAETLSYTALYGQFTVDKSRVRQCIRQLSTSENGLGLVDTFGPHTDKHIELLPAGRQYLDWVDEQIARQQTLEESVSDVLDSSDDSRVTPRTHEGEGMEGAADRNRLPSLHTVQPLSRWNATASAASTPENGVAVVNYPLEPQADRGSPRWYYDYQQDRLTVGAEFDGPLQYWVCIARALTSRRTFAAVLNDGDRLDKDDTFSTFLTEHRSLLRDSRCLAHLPDRVADGADYLDELQTAEEQLCELTRDLAHGDFEGSEAEFRSTITREALGLAGTMVHLLDLVGVDVVRQVRLPTQNSGRNDILRDDRRETLVQSLATGIAIQSKYGHSAVYRQLFETREEKRDAAIVPSIDYDNPFGELIGSVCIVGNLGDREAALVEDLRNRLRAPQELHEDAPEIQVRVPVVATDDLDRTAFATAVERMCAAKNLSPTRSAVSVLRLFTATPFDAAAAVCGLEPESRQRDIRLDEIRYALSAVDEARILPWEAPAVQALVVTLLTAEDSLSVTELTDRAGVDRSTFYDHRDRLVALDLVRDTSAGVRLALPFRGSGESDVRPWFTRRDTCRDDSRLASVGGVVLELLDELAPASDTVQAVSAALQHPVDIDAVRDAWPDLDGWFSALQVATAETTAGSTSDPPAAVVFGRRPEQLSLQGAAAGRVQDQENHASSP